MQLVASDLITVLRPQCQGKITLLNNCNEGKGNHNNVELLVVLLHEIPIKHIGLWKGYGTKYEAPNR